MKEHAITPIALQLACPFQLKERKKDKGGDVLAEIKKECQWVTHEIATKLQVSDAKFASAEVGIAARLLQS